MFGRHYLRYITPEINNRVAAKLAPFGHEIRDGWRPWSANEIEFSFGKLLIEWMERLPKEVLVMHIRTTGLGMSQQVVDRGSFASLMSLPLPGDRTCLGIAFGDLLEETPEDELKPTCLATMMWLVAATAGWEWTREH